MQARIDSHNKILYARHADQRNATFQGVLQTGREFDRGVRSMLLRANLIKHEYNLKASRRMWICILSTPDNVVWLGFSLLFFYFYFILFLVKGNQYIYSMIYLCEEVQYCSGQRLAVQVGWGWWILHYWEISGCTLMRQLPMSGSCCLYIIPAFNL